MYKILDKLKHKNKIIELDFSQEPFIFLNKKREDISNLLESILKSIEKSSINTNNDIQFHGNKIEYKIKDNEIEFSYKKESFKIFKNPINFKFFYEEKNEFKAYNKEQLINILFNLNNYYYFFINNNCFTIKDILNMKKIETIILIPFILHIFNILNCSFELNDINLCLIQIKKETLEPFYLYLEKKEIFKNLDNFELKKDKYNLEDKLLFIYNEKRKIFIDKLNLYSKRKFIDDPMIILGNDGVGKSLTLQFYSLLKLEGYKKFYFNLKLFEKCNFNHYFLIELMRGFISKDKNKVNEDFKKYINCIRVIKNSKSKNFFEILKNLITYLKLCKEDIIIILDQFKYENINEEDFDYFKRNINQEKFRLIICCTLNDGEIKKNIFKKYGEDILLLDDIPKKKENIKQICNKEKLYENKKENKNNESNINESINLKNIYILKKRKISEGILNEEKNNKKKKLEEKIYKENNKINVINLYNKEENIEKQNYNIPSNEEKLLNINKNQEKNIEKKNKIIILEPKYFYYFNLPEIENTDNISYDTNPVKIYYNNLVSLEEIIKDKEPYEIYNFMSNFDYLPKYYNKFLSFRENQKINKIYDNNKIIENFKKEVNSKIQKNIKKFYTDVYKNNNNMYQFLIMFKKKLEKNFDKYISFAKLYKYSKILPFKYLVIEPEVDINYIRFDNDIINKSFKIRYSFPFIEYVINNLIDEFNNYQLFSIYNLSGTAFGIALELKIREYLSNNYNNIEIRKVWTLGNLNENLKKSKLKEIENNTLNSKKYKELEDIINVKKLKYSDNNYFYFYPENKNIYLLDSLIIINNRNNNYSLIAFQIFKNKKINELYSKNEFKNYLINEVKKKFEKLYDINIAQIYLWIILSNEIIENNNICEYLKSKKIKFFFFSLKDLNFYVEKNKDKIKNLLFFLDEDALIFPFGEEDEDYYITNIGFDSIELFENKLFYLSQEYDNINYENIRRDFYKKNCGIKIETILKNNIIDKLKVIVPYENEFYLLYLFSFPLEEYRKLYKCNDEFVFIVKNEGKIYLSYKKNYFEINQKTYKLKSTQSPKLCLSLESEINYNEEEIELSSIKNLDENEIFYLYKIYYLGDSLISKK